MKDINELFDKYLEDEKMWNFEGTDGVRNLIDVCDTLGYAKGQFIGANSIMNFLADNPGAMESILEFIRDNIDGCPEWQENLMEVAMEDEEDELVFTA